MQEETYPQQEEGQEWQQPQQPPQQPEGQQWQQQPQQQPMHQPQQSADFFEGLASNKTLAMVVMLGLMIIMVGSILLNATNSIDDPRHVITMGNILIDVGVFLTAGIMLIGAFYRDDWGKWFRIAIAGFAMVLIVLGYFSIGFDFGMAGGVGGW